MVRIIALFLLIVFSTCNVVIIYSTYKKGMQTSVQMIEEEETHLGILEVKKFLKSELNPFELYSFLDESTSAINWEPNKIYEDVYLGSIETPPDFIS